MNYNATMNLTDAGENLRVELSQVNEQLKELSASDPARSSNRDIDNEMEDDYQESEDGFRAQSLIDEVKRNKQHILRALEKIQNGTYTKCDRCGGPISEERLTALPATLTCLTCQTRQDSRPE